MHKDLELTDDQERVLEIALDFYIRLGLGQFSEIANRLHLLYGNKLPQNKLEKIKTTLEEIENILWDNEKPWTINDDHISIYTLTAFLTETQLANKKKNAEWTKKRIQELKSKNNEKIT